MNEGSLDQISDNIKIVKNSKDINLPSKPKILSNKKSHKQQITQLLVKSSPLKLKNDQKFQNERQNKNQDHPDPVNHKTQQKIDKNQHHERSDSLISSNNTSNLFYDQMNKSQSTVQLHKQKDSLSSYGQNINKNQNRSKSRSKLIRKQTISHSSKNSQTKSNKQLSTSPQFMVQNRFYHYCAQQIIKLSTQTEEMKAKIKNRHIQTDKIRQMNKELQLKIQRQKKEMQEYQNFRQKLQDQRNKLKQQINSYEKQIFENLPQKYKSQYRKSQEEHKAQLTIKISQIKKQQQAIESLRAQLNQFNQSQQKKKQIWVQNKKLRQQIEKVKNKRLKYDQKILKKNHIIKHLQQIKIVEYQNLLNIFN